MIAGIGASGSVQALYPQYNKKKISPVKGVHEERGSLEEISNRSSSDNNTLEDTIASNYQSKLAENVGEQEMIAYNESNPYMQARKSLDESFLVGMNIDVVA